MRLTDDQILDICITIEDKGLMTAAQMVRGLTGISDIQMAVAYAQSLYKDHFKTS